MDNAADNKHKHGYLLLIIPFTIIFALIVAAGIYFYIDYDKNSKLLADIDTTKYEAKIGPEDVWENEIELVGKSILELNEEKKDKAIYTAPNGLVIRTLSEEWNGKLSSVYDELLKNTHGDEIDYIKEINLLSGAPDDGTLGDYQEKSSVLKTAIVFNPLISSSYKVITRKDYGCINIYKMDEYKELKDFARTLSHEYGHHFAFQHIFTDENEDREDSYYYDLRGLSEYPDAKEYTDYQEYLEMHAWDIDEIAAEDYVQLLGSPTSREIGEYMDIKEALYTSDMEYMYDLQPYHYNVFAQENPVIPTAEQVQGLEYYYHSFIDEAYEEEYTDYNDIVIEAKKKRSNGKTHYELTWNELDAAGSEVIYTVVCYNDDGSFYLGIKTVSGEEELSTVIGTPTRRKGNWIYWWDDRTMDEDRIVRVLAYIVDEGIIVGSQPYYFDF